MHDLRRSGLGLWLPRKTLVRGTGPSGQDAGYGRAEVFCNGFLWKPSVVCLVDQRAVFEPERLVGERRAADGTLEYRVRWRGYPPSQDTWEPLEHLQAGRRGLLRDWEKRGGRAASARER